MYLVLRVKFLFQRVVSRGGFLFVIVFQFFINKKFLRLKKKQAVVQLAEPRAYSPESRRFKTDERA